MSHCYHQPVELTPTHAQLVLFLHLTARFSPSSGSYDRWHRRRQLPSRCVKCPSLCMCIPCFCFCLHGLCARNSCRSGADVAAAAVHLALKKVKHENYNFKPLTFWQGCNLMFTATSLLMPLPVRHARPSPCFCNILRMFPRTCWSMTTFRLCTLPEPTNFKQKLFLFRFTSLQVRFPVTRTSARRAATSACGAVRFAATYFNTYFVLRT